MSRVTDGRRSRERLDPLVAVLAARQHSAFTRAQAIELGFSTDQIDGRLATATWVRVLPGVYTVTGARPTGRQGVMAACLWAGADSVASHLAAGVLWQLEGFTAEKIEITVPPTRKIRNEKVRVHRATVDEVDRTTFDAVPITTPARTIVDAAGRLSDDALEAAVESALRRGLFTERFLRWRTDQLAGKGRSGVTKLRALLDHRHSEAALESRLEVKVWRLILRSGLPRPQRQHRVEIDGHRYRLDFAWPDRLVAVEAEGRAAHGGRRRPFYDDRARLADLVSGAWRVVPVTWEDVETRAEVWLTKLAQTLALGA